MNSWEKNNESSKGFMLCLIVFLVIKKSIFEWLLIKEFCFKNYIEKFRKCIY